MSVATIDAANVPLVNDIARHHQPKIDRAEKRVRRLAYLAGDTSDGITAEAAVVPHGDES